MKALSVWQPWATLLATGEKRIETRSWSTMHRGLLAIHAAKHWSGEIEMMSREGQIGEALRRRGFSPYQFRRQGPFGAIVGVARLRTVVRVDALDTLRDAAGVAPLSFKERAFGNYEPGRFAWVLDQARPLPEPIPLRGLQGLYDLPALLADAVRAAVDVSDLE